MSASLIRLGGKRKNVPNVVQMLELMISVLMISHPSSWQVRKQPFDDMIGTGERVDSLATPLPQGTTRKHMKGYEEVKIPATPAASLKPDEKLLCM
jgi:hypothetical protein